MQASIQNLRRLASANGYVVRKRGDGYLIATADTNLVVAGGGELPYNMTLDDVRRWLAS